MAKEQEIARYSDSRRLWHALERSLTFGGWPARLSARLGFPVDVAVEHHVVHVPAALGSAAPLRVAFASDFHCGPSTPPPVVENAIARLGELGAHVLLLGGDFVSLHAAHARDLARRLAEVPAPLGRFAVLGNHDHWSGADEVTSHLRDAGIAVLTNRNVRLPEPFHFVSVCGIDDHTSGRPDAEAAFRDSAPVRLLLMHAPSNLIDAGTRAFAVAFCGHTHGGQIALPNGSPLKVAHGPLSRRYNAGRFDLDDGRVLFVSRGIGCSTVPVRVFAPPSVLGCTVHGQQADGGRAAG